MLRNGIKDTYTIFLCQVLSNNIRCASLGYVTVTGQSPVDITFQMSDNDVVRALCCSIGEKNEIVTESLTLLVFLLGCNVYTKAQTS